MRVPRIHVEADLRGGSTLTLPEQAAEHVARVLRLETGHSIVLFNGDGIEHDAQLVVVGKRSVTAQIGESRVGLPDSPLHVTLVQAIARGEKMDWILQKSTELGVACIVPVFTERTEVKLAEDRAERRSAHWRQVVASACEQSGRSRLPTVAVPQRLQQWAGGLTDREGLRVVLLPAGELATRDIAAATRNITLVVGPEGGISAQDEAILRQAGFKGLSLGPRILRTETAGVVALAVLQALLGDLG